MPVDERTFVAEFAGWVTEFLNGRPDLPFSRATVEEHVAGTALRNDFRLYSDTGLPVLTGEIKMPGSAQGSHPLHAYLVDDALTKASRDGIRYCFTWNVRQFVLFDSHIQNVPYADRHIEGPTNVVDANVSDDVERDWVRDTIRLFWKEFLERFADLLAGRRTFELSPIDQRFIGWLEGALEDPVAHTEIAPCRVVEYRFRAKWSAQIVDALPGDGSLQLSRSVSGRTWDAPRGCRATSWSRGWFSTRCCDAGSGRCLPSP